MKIIDKYNITGRGLVFVISLKDNDIDDPYSLIGKSIKESDSYYIITSIEATKTLMGQINDNVGLVVKKVNLKNDDKIYVDYFCLLFENNIRWNFKNASVGKPLREMIDLVIENDLNILEYQKNNPNTSNLPY